MAAARTSGRALARRRRSVGAQGLRSAFPEASLPLVADVGRVVSNRFRGASWAERRSAPL